MYAVSRGGRQLSIVFCVIVGGFACNSLLKCGGIHKDLLSTPRADRVVVDTKRGREVNIVTLDVWGEIERRRERQHP
ncbi:hypothetical protein CONLIGDRAFT_637907, partial [Coniochaeta ligniaria NRRL 30616]